ncbi:Methionyl-tRNA formyltransferase, partial [Bienertia sinuspersici]
MVIHYPSPSLTTGKKPISRYFLLEEWQTMNLRKENATSVVQPPCSSSLNNKKKPLVFFDSPQVSAKVLHALFNASHSQDSSVEVVAIVTQPPSQRNRGRKVLPSAVAQRALKKGFSSDLIFTPSMRALEPEICITVAYGNIYPTSTVNIHPILLPLYHGAAPVQNGVRETGVSLAFTVRALDTGSVSASPKVNVNDDIKMLSNFVVLYLIGSKLNLHELPSIMDGTARTIAQFQDDSKATLAPKIAPIASHRLIKTLLSCIIRYGNLQVVLELELDFQHFQRSEFEADYVAFGNGALIITCGGGTYL